MRIRSLLAATLLLGALTTIPGARASETGDPVGSSELTVAWAPAATAPIRPGTATKTGSAQCTSNFVFQMGSRVFLGQAAHCASNGLATETDGCSTSSKPLNSYVIIDGADDPGRLVYSSWLTMQARGEHDDDACLRNDFALVEISPRDISAVNPSVPYFGGPTGLGGPTRPGDPVVSFQNSDLRLRLSPAGVKYGTSLGMTRNGWTHNVYSLTPGIPGDSGSGYLSSTGRAIGILSTLVAYPSPGSNNVTDLARALSYMRAKEPSLSGVQLVNGTEPFSLLPTGRA